MGPPEKKEKEAMPRMKPLPVDAPTEPIWYLRGLPYSEYRQTNWWRKRRQEYNETVEREHGFKKCELCHLERHEDIEIPIRFSVHHVTYEHLGYEPDGDLMLICPPCHNLIHFPDSNAARHWIRFNDTSLNHDLEQRAIAARPPAAAPETVG